MNSAISSVVKAHASNPASASKLESETAKSAEQVTGGLNTSIESSVSSKYDTVRLSRDYVNYKMQGENSTLQDMTSQLNSTLVQLFSESSGKKTVFNYQLYSYTETELLELLNQGEISREAYEAETAARDSDIVTEQMKMHSHNAK